MSIERSSGSEDPISRQARLPEGLFPKPVPPVSPEVQHARRGLFWPPKPPAEYLSDRPVMIIEGEKKGDNITILISPGHTGEDVFATLEAYQPDPDHHLSTIHIEVEHCMDTLGIWEDRIIAIPDFYVDEDPELSKTFKPGKSKTIAFEYRPTFADLLEELGTICADDDQHNHCMKEVFKQCVHLQQAIHKEEGKPYFMSFRDRSTFMGATKWDYARAWTRDLPRG